MATASTIESMLAHSGNSRGFILTYQAYALNSDYKIRKEVCVYLKECAYKKGVLKNPSLRYELNKTNVHLTTSVYGILVVVGGIPRVPNIHVLEDVVY